MRIVILGANGLLGSDLTKLFLNDDSYEVFALTKDDLDITRIADVKLKLFQLRPNIIINAVAYSNVEKAEQEKELACLVNGEAVKFLAEVAVDINATLIHYSTDFVFDGKEKGGYPEYYPDLKPLNAYGFSKALGETGISRIQRIYEKGRLKYYLIRTSWMFGEHGNSFVKTMLKLSQNRNELSVINDQIGCPTYSFDLAKRTLEIIENNCPFGIYHVTNSGSVSWYSFAEHIFRIAENKNINVNPIKATQWKSDVIRPQNSVLLNSKLPPLRTWEEALIDYLSNSQNLKDENLI